MNPHALNAHHGAQHTREIIELAGGDVVRLTDAQGIAVCVRAGTAWITQDGDPDDTVIGSGETFVIDRSGLTLVTPIHGATVVFSALPARARTCRIERIHRNGDRYPVLRGRPQRALTGESDLAPAF